MPARRVITQRSQEPRRRFAEELRALRTEKGESLRQLAERLGWDSSHFAKMESGETLGGPEVVEALDQHYGTSRLLVSLWELALGDMTQFKERYRRYMQLEAEAVSLWHFSVSVVPGLLQTAAYAGEVMTVSGTKKEELAGHVRARLSRRERLMEEDAPPFRTILAEAALRTPLRSPEVWREQLTFLLEMAARPNITLQVLPQGAGLHMLISTTAMFLRLGDARTVAHTETAHDGALVEDNAAVERLQRAYDAVRDLALSPTDSQKYVGQILEEPWCDPWT
ncbi:helix-turn-helix domain-containing protein [Streptomyces sp. NPDC091377]|uniref:helix-turn-helix domain-containing protein n=1 Tax=Streptomyces sp. NPDC091377 TaxID=3365995 RepID=UPI0038038D4F